MGVKSIDLYFTCVDFWLVDTINSDWLLLSLQGEAPELVSDFTDELELLFRAS